MTEIELKNWQESIENRLRLLEARPLPKGRGKRAIRDDDRPTEKHREFAKQLGIDMGPAWGTFKNYCLAHDKRYANFEAAFRNWLASPLNQNGGKR